MTYINELLVAFILGIVIGSIFTYYTEIKGKNKDISSPIEKDEIDSLVKVNDSIKLVIENLDSIKDAKVIEVSSLDNDSTLKLFYKLVKE